MEAVVQHKALAEIVGVHKSVKERRFPFGLVGLYQQRQPPCTSLFDCYSTQLFPDGYGLFGARFPGGLQ